MLMTKAKVKHSISGAIWLIASVIILGSVVMLNTTTTTPVLQNNTYNEILSLSDDKLASSRIIMDSFVQQNVEEMTFKLDNSYLKSFELFKSKVFLEKNNHDKAFKQFLLDLGWTVDQDGFIKDKVGNIVDPIKLDCHLLGYFPDKPYIKVNC